MITQKLEMLTPYQCKNTGVGCHFLLQCMKVKSESEVTQSCPTLSDPMDCSLPASNTKKLGYVPYRWWCQYITSLKDKDSTE